MTIPGFDFDAFFTVGEVHKAITPVSSIMELMVPFIIHVAILSLLISNPYLVLLVVAVLNLNIATAI